MNNLYAEKEKGWRTRAAPGEGGGGGCDPARLWGGAGLRQNHPLGPFQTRPDPGVSSPGLPARGPHKSPAQGTASGPLTVA